VSDEPSIAVRDAPERGRYEATIDGALAGVAAYRTRPGRIVFVHTEVGEGFEGRGVGSALAHAVLEDVRARGLMAVPMCPFIAAHIRRHPEFRDLVPEDALRLLEAGAG
jgi:uncharacterized protein